MKFRQLTLLAALTGVFVIAAVIAVMTRATSNLAPFPHQPLFPGLEQQIEAIAKITVDTAQGNIIVTRDARGGWILPDRGGWPANFDVVRKAILALAKLEAVERRTARNDNHSALLLAAPDDAKAAATGKGFRITALNSAGAPLAGMILGKVQTPPSGTRAGVAYARKAGEDQTYLVQGDVNIPLQISDWIDRALFDIAEDRIASVTVTPPGGPAYDITRADPKAAFAVTKTPKGKELVLADLPGNIAKAVTLLPLDDAMPADKIDFTKAFRARHKLFDGMVLTSWTVVQDKSRWTRFEASLDPAQSDAAAKSGLPAAHPELLKPGAVQKQIAAINARTKGWAFKLPGMKAADLTRDYYDLFKTPEPVKKPEEGAGAPSEPGLDELQ
ncbi:MAG: DUF4340 domain-containing protein [Alphaproteobacteria bacterium]